MAEQAQQYAIDASELILAIRKRTTDQLTALWRSLPSWHSNQIDLWLYEAVPLVLAAEESVVDVTAGYVLSQLQLDDPAVVAPIGYAPVTGAPIRNGVPPADVYKRPFVDVWSGLQDQLDLEQAVDNGINRLRQLVETDLQLTHNHAAREVMQRQTGRASGYRRVLVGAKNCGLCIVASTQRYRKRDLQPIHPGCNCRVEPLYGDVDLVLDEDLLNQVHAEIADRFGILDRDARRIDYRKILLVREHGEYGPTLTYASDRFTGPDDLMTPGRRYDRERARRASETPGG